MTNIQAAQAGFVLLARANALARQSDEFLAKFADDCQVSTNVTVNADWQQRAYSKELLRENERRRRNTVSGIHSLAVNFNSEQAEKTIIETRQLSTLAHLRPSAKEAEDRTDKIIVDTECTESWTIADEEGKLIAKELLVQETNKVARTKITLSTYAEALTKKKSPESLSTHFWEGPLDTVEIDKIDTYKGKVLDQEGLTPEAAALVLKYWSGALMHDPAIIAAQLADGMRGSKKLNDADADLDKQTIIRDALEAFEGISKINKAALHIFKGVEDCVVVDYDIQFVGARDGAEHTVSHKGRQRWDIRKISGEMRLCGYSCVQTVKQLGLPLAAVPAPQQAEERTWIGSVVGYASFGYL